MLPATPSDLRAALPVRSVASIASVGLVGTAIVACAAMDGGALPLPWGGTWPVPLPRVPEVPGLGVLPILAAHYGGLVLVIRAWLALRRARPAAAVTIAIAALWAVPLLLGPPIGSRDVYAYVAQGDIAAHDLPAYDATPSDLPPGPVPAAVDPLWRDVPTPYGPAWVRTASVAARVPGPQPVTGVVALRVVALASIALLAFGIRSLARTVGADADDAIVLAVANPLVIVHLVGGAHNEALLAGLVVAGVALARRGRRLAGVAVAALAVTVKAPALLAVAVLAWGAPRGTPWRARIGPAAARLAIAAAVIAATSMVAGLGWGWLAAAGAPGRTLSWAAPATWLGVVIGTDTARALALAVAAGLAVRWTWRAVPGDADVAGRALVAFAVLGPALHPWYLLWGLPLIAAVRAGRECRALVAGSVVALLAGHPGGGQWFEAVLDLDPVAVVVTAAALLAVLVARRPLAPPQSIVPA